MPMVATIQDSTSTTSGHSYVIEGKFRDKTLLSTAVGSFHDVVCTSKALQES